MSCDPRAEWLDRLRRFYFRIDAAYDTASAAYGFVCKGCEDNCCRTRFHHHTLVEYVALRDGFERLSAAEQAQIRRRAEAWCAEQVGGSRNARPLCPLNTEGRCVLYAHRPMICRLHGIPHQLRRPGQPAQRSPGCGDFSRRCGHMPYYAFDRTPLYADLAQLESEFQQALGVQRRFKHTIAEMLLDDRLAP
jgi:Fe-S-cluster containining protein